MSYKVNGILLIYINILNSAREESGTLCDEDKFITQNKLIPNSFDNIKHNDILDTKIGLREIKIQCLAKIIVGHLNITLFFYIRTSKCCLRLAVLNFFIFEAEMFLICSNFPD